MSKARLNILSVSHLPASPPRFGAQARMHGLLTELASNHDLTAVVLLDDDFDDEECDRAMRAYCREVILIPNPLSRPGAAKRLLQLRSLASSSSFERLRVSVPALQQTLDELLGSQAFDIVSLEFPYLGHLHLKQARSGAVKPALVIDSHEIAYDLAHQIARSGKSAGRRIYGGINWRKLRREELAAYRRADGVCLCSVDDQRRLLREIPDTRTAVIPNAADIDYFQPSPSFPSPEARTVVFFGLLSTLPNIDGVHYLVNEIWPRVVQAHPDARLKIIGGCAPPALLALAGPRIEFTGFVDDLRPHLAGASVVAVPLRLGGGTRLKIVEAMAMGRPLVSTALGAEGIGWKNGRDLLIADEPDAFASAVNRLLSDATLADRVGRSARELAVRHYSWHGAASAMEEFYRRVLEAKS